MSDEARVRYETREDGQIGVVTMMRVRYRNALSQQMMDELEATFDEAVADDNVRVLILRGDGPAFSAGHDLGSPDMADRAERDAQPMSVKYDRSRQIDPDVLLRFRSIPKPTIAMVHGHVIYAAWMLASSMDVVFAAEDTQFLGTNFQYFSVPWDIGVRKAKHLLFENRFIDGREAMEIGFVSEIFPPEELEAGAIAYALRVAEMDPFQLRMIKHSINQMEEIQGFRAHIYSSHSDHAVRSANTAPRTEPGDGDSSRHLYLNVERAKSRDH
jgi:enoyl-CoA hydratase